MKMKCVSVLVVVLLAGVAFASGQMFENRAAQRALERYEQQVERAEREYAEAMERATTRYREELERALGAAMRAGEAGEAREIQEELGRIEYECASLEQQIAGRRYSVNGGPDYMQLNEDGTLAQSRGRNGEWAAAGQHELAARVGDEQAEWRIVFSADRSHALIIREPGRTPSFAQILE